MMAQTRFRDVQKVSNGFCMVVKAFVDQQSAEVNQVWANSSIRAAVQELQYQAEETVSDSIVTEPRSDFLDNWAAATGGPLDVPLDVQDWPESMGVTGLDESSTAAHTEPSRTASPNSSSINKKRETDGSTKPTLHTLAGQPPSMAQCIAGSNITRTFHSFARHPPPAIAVCAKGNCCCLTRLEQPSNPGIGPTRQFNYDSSTPSVSAEELTKERTKSNDPTKKPPRVQKTRKREKPKLSEQAKESSVPSTRLERVVSFGSLAAGLGLGAVAEKARRAFGNLQGSRPSSLLDGSLLLTEANAERIVETLCRVRGAALKLGQMLSIQDNTMISPELQKIFERVRQSADFMPTWQMEKVLKKELGDDWRSKVESFDDKPFAAASIGQVHLATLTDGREVAMKIQYPGVAEGIESDINNLMTLLNIWNVLPPGMYAENAIDVMKMELGWEVDYTREAECSEKVRKLLSNDEVFFVPEVIFDLSSKQVLANEFAEGIPLEKTEAFDQETRNYICTNILRLCLTELYEWHVMQTDPNWSNFLYNPDDKRIALLDFGATRIYTKSFVNTYMKIIRAAATGDKDAVLENSIKLGFLTGYETRVMQDAHVDAVMILGEPFAWEGNFDFATQDTTQRIQKLLPVMLDNRLTPPPEESYSLHRKMSGAFLLCAKLRANVPCKQLFDDVYEKFEFSD